MKIIFFLGFIKSFILAAPITFLYHTLFVYEKKLREKSNFRQSLIIGTLGKSPKKFNFF
jgi:hypothetical protein